MLLFFDVPDISDQKILLSSYSPAHFCGVLTFHSVSTFPFRMGMTLPTRISLGVDASIIVVPYLNFLSQKIV